MKVTSLMLLLTYFVLQVSASNIFIGGIFESRNSMEEVAFEVAIDMANSKRYFPGRYLKSLKFHIQRDDVIDAQKAIVIDHNWNKPYNAIQGVCSLLQHGVVGVFNLLTDENAYAVQSLCDNKEVPVIQTKLIYDYHQGWNSINLFPRSSVLVKAFADLVRHWKWKSFTVLYEQHTDLSMLSEVLKLDDCKSLVEQLIIKNDTFIESLKLIRDSEQVNFVLYCSTDSLSSIFEQLQKVGLMVSDYNYIVLNLDMHTIDFLPYQYSNANITFLRLFNPLSRKIVQINKAIRSKQIEIGLPIWNSNQLLNDSKVPTSTYLLIDAVMHFAETFRKHNFKERSLFCNGTDSWEHGSTLFNFLKTHTMRGLTDNLELDQHGYRSNFRLKVVELRKQGPTQIGYWNQQDKLNINRPNLTEGDTKLSMSDLSLKVAITLAKPYAMLKFTSTILTGNNQYEGFSIDLIHELSLLEGFNYTFLRNPDDRNGNYNPATRKWDGMMEDVISGVADVAIGDLTITRQRKQFVDFTSPFLFLGIQMLVTKPNKAEPDFFSFAEPFHFEIWILIIMTIPVMSIAFFIIGRICPSEWCNPHPCIEEPRYLKNQFHFTNCIWIIVANMTQEGADVAPRGLSTRLLSGFWAFFILIIASVYTANMAAFLTADKIIWPFTNVKELSQRAEKLGIKIGAVANGTTHKFFLESDDPVYKSIGLSMKKNPQHLVSHYEEGVDLALEDEKYVFFMESSTIKYITQRNCNLTEVGDFLDHKYYGIAMQKDSKYRNTLSAAVLKLMEKGTIDELARVWWEKKRGGDQCAKPVVDAAPPLYFKHVSGIFWITFEGILLSFVLVFVEVIIQIMRKYKNNRQRLKALKEDLLFYWKFQKYTKKVKSSQGDNCQQNNVNNL